MYVNFLLFQLMLDVWGIDQFFLVLLLEGLDQVLECCVVLLDIICDFDGVIDYYIDGDGIVMMMLMLEYDLENLLMFGFFMVGVYQEIFGNMYNLFGDIEVVDVFVFLDGSVEVELLDEGDIVVDML